MDRIGIRELRQHASRYLARVAKGERIEVTHRGRPVAMLVPVSGERFDDLVASGRIAEPSEPGDLLDELPQDYGVDAAAILRDMRSDER